MILDELAVRNGTDKARGGHNYCVWYECFLRDIRDAEVKVLEIGVGNGASLRVWRDYFQHGKIIGFDISDGCRSYAEERISIEIGNQGSNEDLQRVANTHGPFDLILDDGSHQPDHQMFTLAALVPHVKPKGFYILEDIESPVVVNYLDLITMSIVRNDGNWSRVESISFYEQSTILRMKS